MNQQIPNAPIPGEFPATGSARSWKTLARPGVAWLVLALCLVATGIGWWISLSKVHTRSGYRFALHVDRVKREIESRMKGYEQVLNGAAGLFAASKSVERDEWHQYFEKVEINQRYPGIRALGFIACVPRAERETFIASNRLERPHGYTIQPDGERTNYYAVKFVEPELRNLSSLGYDIASDTKHRDAANYARRTGAAVVTGAKHHKRYERGRYEVEGTPVYVNRGVGTLGIPLRLLCRPEVALIELGPPK